MMDRLVIVVYINIENFPGDVIEEYIERVREQLKEALDDNDICWVFPTTGGDNRVELLNKPHIITSEEYKNELEEKIKRLEDKIDDKIKNKEVK